MYCTVSSKIDTKVFSTVRVHCTRTSTRTCTVQLVTRRATVRVRVLCNIILYSAVKVKLYGYVSATCTCTVQVVYTTTRTVHVLYSVHVPPLFLIPKNKTPSRYFLRRAWSLATIGIVFVFHLATWRVTP